jgi:nucleotide-binding universal stress UspA family protein
LCSTDGTGDGRRSVELNMIALKNILVATDFGEASAVALAYGRTLARTYNARLHLVHAVENVLMRYSPEVAFSVPEMQKDLETAAWRDLRALITEDDRDLAIVPVVETAISVPNALVEYAKANAIDLIVIGTHGRGAMTQLLMGSVAERVVRTAPCPVLAVHAKERDFLAPDALIEATTA